MDRALRGRIRHTFQLILNGNSPGVHRITSTRECMAQAEERGDRRQGDRREGDRRSTDRRFTPTWRRPWALVAYGVLATLAVVLALRSIQGEEESAPPAEPVARVVSRPSPERPVLGPAEDALTGADFERLLAEGGDARGRLVRVGLLCKPPTPFALRTEVDNPSEAVLSLADQRGYVPAAECTWGEGEAERDFLLVVPPGLAEDVAQAPVVKKGFVERRRIRGVVEWVGLSEALALKTAGVLRSLPAGG